MGEVRQLPTDPDDVVERYTRKGVTEPMPRLTVRVGPNSLNFFFNSVDPIEFDLHPKDVTSDKALQDLFDFLRRLGTILEKDVVVTDEAIPYFRLLKYDHERDEFVEDLQRPDSGAGNESIHDMLRRFRIQTLKSEGASGGLG